MCLILTTSAVQTLGTPYVFDLFLEVLFCVLTVGLSPTKSMSTKNPKLGNTRYNSKVKYVYYIYIYLSVLFFTVEL